MTMQEELIKVVVRVRPLSPKEKLQNAESCLQIIPGGTQLILGKDRAFTFDHIFFPDSTQEDIYQFCVKSLVQSCFEGYNATIFAYGQTGSGKTYTIGGGDIAALTEEEYGIIPRAIRHIFEIVKENKKINYIFKVSYIEIYKEELIDLLDLDTSGKDIHIREDDQGNTIIIGNQEVPCNTAEDVINCLETGSSLRHIGCTLMNEHSSRSHSIFTLVIEQSWTDSIKVDDGSGFVNNEDSFTQYRYGKFHFVDLAGSERVDKTGNTGERFKESVHINTGLLALGNVISALSDAKRKVSHIPYRDSKLTRILKDSLGGNSKTAMICCVSPCITSFDESLNSLKYANRAKDIKNKPIINRDPQSLKFEAMQSEIMALRDELQRHHDSLCTTASEHSVGNACGDPSDIKMFEGQVFRLQSELSHYKMLGEEAQDLLKDIEHEQSLTEILQERICEWLELMEEIESKVPVIDPKINWQKSTVEQAETIKWQRKEIEELRERLAVVDSKYNDNNNIFQETVLKLKLQEEQIKEKCSAVDNLEKQIMFLKEKCGDGNSEINNFMGSGSIGETRRIKSAPMIGTYPEEHSSELPPRSIHTSPALFSLERIFQGFHVKSQMLISSLEESDEVQQQKLRDSRTAMRLPCFNKEHKMNLRTPIHFYHEAPLFKNKARLVSASAVINRSTSVPFTFLNCHRNRKNINPMSSLQTSLEFQRQQLKEAQIMSWETQQKMRDLKQIMTLKETVIKELILTSKQAQTLNRQYQEKIETLEKEVEQTKLQLAESHIALKDLEMKEQLESTEKQRLRSKYQKKIEQTNSQFLALQKKKNETEKVFALGMDNDKRIHDLEQSLEKMKGQYDLMHKKLKEETERKFKLEKELYKDQQKIQELENRNEQQQKVLKRKTQEVAAAQRKLRIGGKHNSEEDKIEEQRKWLDSEIEKLLVERQQMKELEEELSKRESIVSRREHMMNQKAELEIKKLKSSQIISQDILTVANKLEDVEKQLEKKNTELSTISSKEGQDKLRKEITELRQLRENLIKQRMMLDEKLQQGNLLPVHQERKLIELDEAIEAIDAAIEYKNELISNQQKVLQQSQLGNQNEDSLINRLNSLSTTEIKSMLLKYFEKVVDLREDAQKKDIMMNDMEARIDQQDLLLRELQNALRRNAMERDCKLLRQQQDYEQKIQLLIQQVNEANESNSEVLKNHQKDLYFYKVQCRNLQKELLMSRYHQPERSQLTQREESSRIQRNMFTHNKDINSVKISRRELRQLSESEIALRRSTFAQDGSIPADSIESSASFHNS